MLLREDDRTILQTCQQMGAKSETFQHIADSLKNKTAKTAYHSCHNGLIRWPVLYGRFVDSGTTLIMARISLVIHWPVSNFPFKEDSCYLWGAPLLGWLNPYISLPLKKNVND